MQDKINPNYYTWIPGIECKDVIGHFPTNLGCAVKYLWRLANPSASKYIGKQERIEDLRKAIRFIEFQIELVEKEIDQSPSFSEDVAASIPFTYYREFYFSECFPNPVAYWFPDLSSKHKAYGIWLETYSKQQMETEMKREGILFQEVVSF